MKNSEYEFLLFFILRSKKYDF